MLAAFLTMAGLGAFHGLNPAMGWLFALSLGLQRGSERAIDRALVPIALGHAASLAVVAAALFGLGLLISPRRVALAAAVTLLAFGLYRLARFYRHPRWVGMRVSFADLCLWSFIMASAHGAGIMLGPSLASASAHAHGARFESAGALALGVAIHTVAMLGVMALVAHVVYRRFGLRVLREYWINFDLVWAIALVVAGLIAAGMAVS